MARSCTVCHSVNEGDPNGRVPEYLLGGTCTMKCGTGTVTFAPAGRLFTATARCLPACLLACLLLLLLGQEPSRARKPRRRSHPQMALAQSPPGTSWRDGPRLARNKVFLRSSPFSLPTGLRAAPAGKAPLRDATNGMRQTG